MAIGERKHNKTAPRRSTRKDEPLFSDGMDGIGHRHHEIIIECRRGLLKADAMPAEVSSGLQRIPFEAEGHVFNLRGSRVHPPDPQVQLQASQTRSECAAFANPQIARHWQRTSGGRRSDPTQPVAIGADHLVSEPSGTRTSQAVDASADRAGGNSPAASAGQAATVLALCVLLSMSASISMKMGAVITQGKPRNNSLVENVGEK